MDKGKYIPYPLGMDTITLDRYKWLRSLMPLAQMESLRVWAALTLSPLTVVVTTRSGDGGAAKRAFCRRVYASPFFVLRFAHASDDLIADISSHESFVYPRHLAGNIFKIRAHIEKVFFLDGGFLIISDDDPGSSFRNGGYQPKFPRAIHPQLVHLSSSGAARIAVTPEQLSLLWHGAFHLGQQQGCAYVGLNSSEQNIGSLPGYETTGANPNRSFGTYGFRPIQLDVAITGAAGILRPLRQLVPKELQSLHQEWATLSALAISEGFGTLMIMPVQATFAVKPPRDAESDIQTLARLYPTVVKPGNAHGGRSNEEKMGCIVHFITAKQLDI